MTSTKKIKHILSIGCLLLLVGTPLLTTFAQTEEVFLDDEGTTNAPQLYVHNIEADEITAQSTHVTGSFELFNVGLQTASDISHQASLVTLEKIGNNVYPLDMVVSGERSDRYLAPNGKQEQDFSVQIPTGLPENAIFGIYIEIFTDDEPGAYEFIPIDLDTKQPAKQVSYVDVIGGLRIGDEKFFLLEGPTVLKGEQVALFVQVASTSAYTTLQPRLEIYKGSMITSVPMRVLEAPALTISKTTATETTYSLPVDLGPGVYTLQLHYVNNEGVVVSPLIEGRYILDGLKSNIHEVTYNELDQNKIDTFEVFVQYAEKPLSARIGVDGSFIDPRAEQIFVKEGEEPFVGTGFADVAGLTMRVTLSDERTGKKIDEQSSIVAALKPTAFSFKPIHTSSKVNVSVELFENDMSIDTHTAVIDVIPRVRWIDTHFLSVIIGSAVLLIVLCVGFFIALQNRSRAKRETVPMQSVTKKI